MRDEAVGLTRIALAQVYDDVLVQNLYLEASGKPNRMRDMAGRFCKQPFIDFEIMSNGDVFPCCCIWVPFPIGNIWESSWQEIWNHRAQVTS